MRDEVTSQLCWPVFCSHIRISDFSLCCVPDVLSNGVGNWQNISSEIYPYPCERDFNHHNKTDKISKSESSSVSQETITSPDRPDPHSPHSLFDKCLSAAAGVL